MGMKDVAQTVCDDILDGFDEVDSVAVVITYKDGTMGTTWSGTASSSLLGGAAYLQHRIALELDGEPTQE